jgi:hypothetical protein
MEQNLLQDLVAESIRINGIDVYYIPRTTVSIDPIFNEDPLKEYNRAFFVDVYVKSVDGFQGEGQFLQKFNLEIRDTITFSISTRTFQDEIGRLQLIERPREGDLIYFPQANRLFSIFFVEKYPVFLPLGTLTFFDLKCEMYEYSGEVVNTGVYEIDSYISQYSPALNDQSLITEDNIELKLEDGYSIILEEWDINNADLVAQNDELESAADDFIDFTQINPFGETNP